MRRGQRLIAQELFRLSPGSVVLSVGEGSGEDVMELARRFPALRFLAFDLDGSAVSDAHRLRERLGIRNVALFVGDASRIPLADRSVDIAYVRGVLHILATPERHVIELARVTRRLAVYRDIGNWPFYPLLRRIQAVSLAARRRPGASLVLRDARRTESAATTRRHALGCARWLRKTGVFRQVRVIGHDLLWWDLDRPLGILGLAGARFGLRCELNDPRERA